MKKMLIILGIVLLLFGCVKITVEQKVNKDGTSINSMVVDYEKIASLGSAYGSSGSSMGCDADSWDNLKSEGWTCDQLNATAVKFSGKTQTPEDGNYTFSSTSDFLGATYTLEMPLGLDEFQDSAYGAQMGEGVTQLKQYGVEMWYTLEMPAPITSAEGAVKIEGNKATFDMLDLMANGKTSVKVESKETNLLIIGVVALVVLVVLAFVAMKLMKKK